jgi:hypothetical protein
MANTSGIESLEG